MHRFLKHIFVSILLCLSLQLSAQLRTLYVDDFSLIMSSSEEKIRLLSYAQANQIDYLILYELHIVDAQYDLTSSSSNQILADFIYQAKMHYGISKIGVAAENAWFIENRMMPYNDSRTDPLEKLDVIVMEFEFWTASLVNTGGYYCNSYLQPNAYPCDTDGAFQFCLGELQTMKSLALASSHPMTVEMYVGWPETAQLQSIADEIDLIYIHAYVADPSTAFSYAETRLEKFDTYSSIANVRILFSAEPLYLGPWLSNNSMAQLENAFLAALSSSTGTWKSQVNIVGFTYFAYTYFPCDIGNTHFTGIADVDEIHISNQSISSTNDILSSSSVLYQSHSEVLLDGGFTVSLGSELDVLIENCD